jgi:type IV pilus assembly protein PilY1
VIFVTVDPSADKCDPGGTSWLMELDATTGAAPTESVFDFNGDDAFDSNDNLSSGAPAAGLKSTVGITKTPVWLDKDSDKTIGFKEMSGTSGGIMPVKNKGGSPPPPPPGGGANGFKRLYWKQIL